MNDFDKLPEELKEGRNIIECNFIFCFYKNIDLLSDYENIKPYDDIITEDGIFYFSLIRRMSDAGFNIIDDASIMHYLGENTEEHDIYKDYGGWDSIEEMMNVSSEENLEIYYDDLCKSNLLIRLYKKGFNILKNLNAFKEMNCQEVYDYYDYTLSKIAIDKIEKIKSENLSTGYDKYIDLWDSGSGNGYAIEPKYLNYRTLGIHKKNLTLHLSGIGFGKTTSAIAWYVLPIIKKKSICIIANEQDVSEWRQMILATVLFNELGNRKTGLSRHKIMQGGFTEEQRMALKSAEKWLEEQPGKIEFIETQDYDSVNIKKIMKQHTRDGIEIFLIDTLKPINESSDRSWAEFSEVVKDIFITTKTLDAATIATAQLAPEAMSRCYLDLTCVGKSKAIAETASTVIMFRPIRKEEKEKVRVYNWDKELKKNIEENLDVNKDYIIIFTPKNRFGPVSPQIVCERNMEFNSYRQVGYYECPFDFDRRK